MKNSRSKPVRSNTKQRAPEKRRLADNSSLPPAVNREQAEVIALLREIADSLAAIREYLDEQLHLLRNINSGLP